MACWPGWDRCSRVKIADRSLMGIANLLSMRIQVSTIDATGQNWTTYRPCFEKDWTSLSKIALFIGPRNSSSTVSSASNPTSNRLGRATISFFSCEMNGFVLMAHTPSEARSWRARFEMRLRRHFSMKRAIDCSGVLGGHWRFLLAWLLRDWRQ